jgi:hypothetical protein
MQQWFVLQHVGFLQWLVKSHAFNYINKKNQISFAFIFLTFYYILYNFEVYACQLFAILMGMGPRWCTTTS